LEGIAIAGVRGLLSLLYFVVWNLKDHRRSFPTTENRTKVIANRFSCPESPGLSFEQCLCLFCARPHKS